MENRKWKNDRKGKRMQSYKELHVYKKSYEQAKEIYRVTKAFPKEELYAMTSQIKRAATSIPLNIAEGYGKVEMGKEVLRYLSMARGSSAEMEVLLEFSKDFEWISEEEYRELVERQQVIGKMLTRLMQSLNQSQKLNC